MHTAPCRLSEKTASKWLPLTTPILGLPPWQSDPSHIKQCLCIQRQQGIAIEIDLASEPNVDGLQGQIFPLPCRRRPIRATADPARMIDNSMPGYARIIRQLRQRKTHLPGCAPCKHRDLTIRCHTTRGDPLHPIIDSLPVVCHCQPAFVAHKGIAQLTWSAPSNCCVSALYRSTSRGLFCAPGSRANRTINCG